MTRFRIYFLCMIVLGVISVGGDAARGLINSRGDNLPDRVSNLERTERYLRSQNQLLRTQVQLLKGNRH